jgi:hypothetical protein
MRNSISGINNFFKHQKSKILIRNLLKEKQEIWLEVGSDKKGENSWITVDISNNPDILWDLR